MTIHASTRHGDSMVAGTVTVAMAVLLVASVVWTYVLSLSGIVDAPNWVRALGSAGIPIGLAGVPIAYTFARTGDGLHRGRLGVLIALVGLVAFVALMVALG